VDWERDGIRLEWWVGGLGWIEEWMDWSRKDGWVE